MPGPYSYFFDCGQYGTAPYNNASWSDVQGSANASFCVLKSSTDPNHQPKPASAAAVGASLAAPGPSDSIVGSVIGAIGGAVQGYATGGLTGAATGAVAGWESGQVPPPSQPSAGSSAGGCPTGYAKVGGTCVATNAGAYLPGGQPATVPTTGVITTGGSVAATGGGTMPTGTGMTVPIAGVGLQPAQVSAIRRVCVDQNGQRLRGWVLGANGLCYPKSMLPKKWRKWVPAPRPPVTAADAKAIRRAHSAVKRVERLGKSVGLHVYKNVPRARSSKKRK